jgi:polyribonucleotide nucleotidyltransferase
MLGAVMFAPCRNRVQPVIDAIIEAGRAGAKEPWEIDPPDDTVAKMKAKLKLVGKDIAAAYKLTDKSSANAKERSAREGEGGVRGGRAARRPRWRQQAMKKLEADVVRGAILKDGKRIDGRDTTSPPDRGEVGIPAARARLGAVHPRRDAGALVTTLGTGEDEQIIDALERQYRERFMLHYNFPPYSVGEVGRWVRPGRREIGHGKLAWRALHPVLPSKDRSSPTRSASCRRSPSRTARPRWPRSAAARWR